VSEVDILSSQARQFKLNSEAAERGRCAMEFDGQGLRRLGFRHGG
jgi:hypothetical protein